MTSKFPAKIRFTTALISSAILVSGCATDPSTFGALRPIYRAQGDLPGVSAQPFYEAGKRYFAEKRYGLALEAFQSELRYNEKSVNALNGIAACYDKLNRYDLAVSYYYRALNVDPESTRTLSNLGYSFLLQRRDADAERVLALALNKDPGNVYIKRNLALATSHVQQLANATKPDPKHEEIRQASSTTEQAVLDETTAGSNRSEPAASGMIVRVTDGETQSTVSQKKVEPAPAPTVAEVAVVEEQVAQADLEPQQIDVVSSQMNTEVAVSEPAIFTDVAVADSGLLPAIEIISQVEEQVAQTDPEPQQIDVVSPQLNTEVAVSEPATVTEVAVADSGLLPVIEITSQVEEQVAQADPEPQQIDVVSPQLNTKAAISEQPTVTEVAVADSGLLPAIEIISQVEEQVAQADPELQQIDVVSPQLNTEAAISEQPTVSEVAVADSGLLPAIEIISQVEVQDEQAPEQTHKASETSAPVLSGITTIDVDVALAEANVVKIVGTETVATSGSGQQQDAMQNEQSKSPVTVHGSFEYTIEVSNGNGWNGMARLLGNHLKSKGEHVVRLTNADTFNYKDTVIYYSIGKREVAEQVAGKFPVQARLQETKWNRADIDVRVVIGEDVAYRAPDVRRSLYAWDNNDVSKSLAATVEVSNGNGRNGMARLLRGVLVNRGDSVRRVTNADNFDHKGTVIYFSKGRHKDAQQLAAKLPVHAILKETNNNRKDIDLKIVIGKDFLNYEVAMRQIMDANA